MTTKAALLQRGKQAKIEAVNVDGELIAYVRRMTAGERSSYRMEILQAKDSGSDAIQASQDALLIRTICDESGVRLFADDDRAELLELDPLDADALFEVAHKLNSRKPTEDIEKNLPATES
jgi:hypothetical protein